MGFGTADDITGRWLGGGHVPGERDGLQLRHCTWLCWPRDRCALG